MTAFNSKSGGFQLTTVGRVQTPTLALVARREDRLRSLAADIERDRGRRQQIIGTVDEALRSRYEMILSRRGGLAVVAVRDGTCQGCRMRVPPQLYNQIQRNDQVFLCPSCQRMLHWRPEQSEAS